MRAARCSRLSLSGETVDFSGLNGSLRLMRKCVCVCVVILRELAVLLIRRTRS